MDARLTIPYLKKRYINEKRIYIQNMTSPYKVKHWSPVKRIPKSVDGWYNVLEWEDVDADEYKNPGSESSSDFFIQLLRDHKHSTT